MTLTAMPGRLRDSRQVPTHCGEEMRAMPDAAAILPGTADYVTWRCFCGYQQDAPADGSAGMVSLRPAGMDPAVLVAALSRVEKLRWELDAATFELQAAVGEAIQAGVSIREIAAAVDLDSDEVKSLVS